MLYAVRIPFTDNCFLLFVCVIVSYNWLHCDVSIAHIILYIRSTPFVRSTAKPQPPPTRTANMQLSHPQAHHVSYSHYTYYEKHTHTYTTTPYVYNSLYPLEMCARKRYSMQIPFDPIPCVTIKKTTHLLYMIMYTIWFVDGVHWFVSIDRQQTQHRWELSEHSADGVDRCGRRHTGRTVVD